MIGSFMRRYGFFNIASPFTLEHWHNLFADPIFLESLKNSLIIASVTAAGGILLYSALAYLLVSRRTITAPLLESLMLDSPCFAGHSFESRCPLAFSRDAVALGFVRHGVGHRLGADTWPIARLRPRRSKPVCCSSAPTWKKRPA